MTRLHWLIAIVLILIVYGFGAWVYWNNTRHYPYERPPARTVEEQRKVEKATYKIGRHVIIDGVTEIVIVMENGGKRTIKRG